MTSAKAAVVSVCQKASTVELNQISIDLIQEVEDLTNLKDISAELIDDAHYKTENLLEAICPDFGEDIELLTALSIGLSTWREEVESTNKLLGLPPES